MSAMTWHLGLSIPENIKVFVAQEDIQGKEAAETGGFPELASAFKSILQLATE
jgi:hypothetical protein